MSLVFIGINHKKPFLLLSLISGIPLTTIIQKTLDVVQASSRSLIGSENPFEVPSYHIDLHLRSPTSSPNTSNPKTSIKDDCLSNRTPPIGESP
jgi:hypothetical protein